VDLVRPLIIAAAIGVLVVRAPLAGHVAQNRAAIAAAKGGLDQSWTLHWTWDRAGRLEPGIAPAVPSALEYATLRDQVVSRTASVDERPWEILASVKRDEAAGRHDSALQRLRQREASRYLIPIAERQLAAGDTTNARRLAELAYEATPDVPEIDGLLGQILVVYGTDQKSVLEALEVLGRALRLQPGNAVFERGYAHALLLAGRYDEALHFLSRPEVNRDDDPVVHLLRGDVFAKQGRRDLAVAELQRALTIDPGYQAARDALRQIQ
jgi:predicted Zn-dependent protease